MFCFGVSVHVMLPKRTVFWAACHLHGKIKMARTILLHKIWAVIMKYGL